MVTTFAEALEQLAGRLDRATCPFEVFGHDTEGEYRRLAKLCHPDRFPAGAERDRAACVFRRLTEWRDAALQAAVPRRIASSTHEYRLERQLAAGDLADVHLAVADGVPYVLKVTRPAEGSALLANEARCLQRLVSRCGKCSYREYLPNLIETFTVPSAAGARRVNVFAYCEGHYTLEAVRQKHPAGLDARHLAWIFKRMLVAIGFAHACGFVHGAVLPPHLMLQTEQHGLQLLDWIHAVRTGGVLAYLPTAYRDWYPGEVLRREPAGPTTDLFLAARSLIFAAGGDPVAQRWPDTVPEEMQRFVNTCLFAAPRMRPQDAWELHEEFDALLVRLFGPPKYHRLVMS